MKTSTVVAICAFAGTSCSALALYNQTWDWTGNARTLYFDFAGGQYDIANVQVFGGMNPKTLKDSFKEAINIWNNSQTNNNCKWDLRIGPAVGGNPQIIVKLGAAANGNQAVDGNGVPRFKQPNSVESKFEDPSWPDVAPGIGGGPYDGLAFTRRYMNGNLATSAEIIFSPLAAWQLVGAATYDPVIASLHEIGHTMRLMDQIGNVIMGNPYFGTIMAESLRAGVHDANANANSDYNPSAGDIADIQLSCADCSIPAPGAVATGLAAIGFGACRRRRAA
ncbi:MAG: hypothetical protein J0L78_04785 [Planctomycetes bacterium]|nr:hypothetical protein [Planctomycetota bacterium]